MHRLAAVAALTFALPLLAETSATPCAAPLHHATHAIARKPLAAHRVAAPVARLAPPAVVPTRPTAAPIVRPAPFAQNPINQLRGSARALLVFAPDTVGEAYTRQMHLLDHHELPLTERDTVFVSEVTQHHGPDFVYPGESIQAGTLSDELSARRRFGLREDQFAVILLNKNGVEQFRSPIPVSADALAAEIDENDAANDAAAR